MSRSSFGELDGQDPYDILELPPTASDADIRAARKRLLRRYHPDMPSGDLRRTQLITAAADLLLDPLRRNGYYDLRDEQSRWTVFATADDRYGANGPSTAGGASAGPTQPIRPTFVTPPGASSPRTDPFQAASAFASAGFFVSADSFAPSSAPAWDASGPAAPRPGAGTAQAGEGTTQAGAGTTQAGAGTTQAGEAVPQAGGATGGHLAASRWNALAVASVVAILTWTPIPLVLGLLALRQIRRYHQRGTRLAVTGIAVGAVLILVYLYILVSSGF